MVHRSKIMRLIAVLALLSFAASPAFACGAHPPNSDIHKITKSQQGKKVYLTRCGGHPMRINRSS
jgi:hypothetical protein